MGKNSERTFLKQGRLLELLMSLGDKFSQEEAFKAMNPANNKSFWSRLRPLINAGCLEEWDGSFRVTSFGKRHASEIRNMYGDLKPCQHLAEHLKVYETRKKVKNKIGSYKVVYCTNCRLIVDEKKLNN